MINLPGVPLNWPLSARQQSRVDHFIDLVNQTRKAEGLPALRTGSSGMRQAAAIRAAEISIKFSHYRPTDDPAGDYWPELLKALKVSYTWAAENIAGINTPEAALEAFLNSDGHRRNILSTTATTIAIGVYTDKSGKDWWVQEFTN